MITIAVVGIITFIGGVVVGRGWDVVALVAKADATRHLYDDLADRASLFEKEVRIENPKLCERALLRTRNQMEAAVKGALARALVDGP